MKLGAPVQCVAVAGRHVIAVGARFYASSDEGRSFADVTPEGAALRFPGCAIAADGWAWVFDGDLVGGGHLFVRAPGGAFARRSPAHRDMRVIVLNPADGREAWVGAWGGGVYRSVDGGGSFTRLGLRGGEVRSLAVDFAGRRVYAATSNLISPKGVWTRPFE